MLRFQEFERSTVDTEGAMGLAAILAGKLPELKGKRCVKRVNIIEPYNAQLANYLNKVYYSSYFNVIAETLFN